MTSLSGSDSADAKYASTGPDEGRVSSSDVKMTHVGCTLESWHFYELPHIGNNPNWDYYFVRDITGSVIHIGLRHRQNNSSWKKGANVLFNDILNTFYLRSYVVRYMVKYHWDNVREETLCRHVKIYSFWLTSEHLYALSHTHNNTYHGLFYTNHGTLVGMRNSSTDPP